MPVKLIAQGGKDFAGVGRFFGKAIKFCKAVFAKEHCINQLVLLGAL